MSSSSGQVILQSGTGTGQLSFTSGILKVDVDTIKTQILTAAAGITFPTSIASPTNITAGTITTATNLTNAPTVGDLTAAMKASVTVAATASLNTTTYDEPLHGTPGATITLAQKIGFLYKAWRNHVTQTSSTYSLYNDDAVTVDHKATVSDNGTTFDRTEVATGP